LSWGRVLALLLNLNGSNWVLNKGDLWGVMWWRRGSFKSLINPAMCWLGFENYVCVIVGSLMNPTLYWLGLENCIYVIVGSLINPTVGWLGLTWVGWL